MTFHFRRSFSLLSAAAFLATGPAFAETPLPPPKPEQVQTAALLCAALLQEVSAAEHVIEQANAEKRNATATNVGAGLAQGAGVHLIGGIAGPIGLIGTAVLGVATTERHVDAEIMKRDAKVKRTALLDIYAGKGCDPAAIEPAAGEEETPPPMPQQPRKFND